MTPTQDSQDIPAFLASLTREPGVYRMYDQTDRILYVGKARNLRNRVSSYFRASGLSVKTQALVARISRIEITVTLSDTEALLLEQTLIKEHRPPYNILLRDDKSYPYIHLSDHEFPRITYHRGSKKAGGQYFGPWPGSLAVRDTLNWVEKTFRLRPCDDVFFRNRTRPCLKFQVGRCSGPCVGEISNEAYAEQVKLASLFLRGRNDEIFSILSARMEAAALRLAFEEAARWRDQLAAIRHVQEQQYVDRDGGDVDVVGVAERSGLVCIQVLFVRAGRVLGGRHHIQSPIGIEESEGGLARVLEDFIPAFYAAGSERGYPREILVPMRLEFGDAIGHAISTLGGVTCRVTERATGTREGWLRLAEKNASEQPESHLVNRQHQTARVSDFCERLGLATPFQRIECFDISHTGGEATVASCVVFDEHGPLRSAYRRFNIDDVTPGDDYAAIHAAVRRRYKSASSVAQLPDVIIIDGGPGQMNAAVEALGALGLSGERVLGIAKGTSRKAGLESMFTLGRPAGFMWPRDCGATLLIQHIRDEAHRYALTGHRGRREKVRSRSSLESLEGVGPARRKRLLTHFGGMAGLRSASREEIARVKGIGESLAEMIYESLHSV